MKSEGGVIDKEQILKIAHLSRLEIADKEASSYSDQLGKALSFFQQIEKIDVTGVPPLISPFEFDMKLREDIKFKEFTAEEILSNAPDRSGNLFKVPPAFEEK